MNLFIIERGFSTCPILCVGSFHGNELKLAQIICPRGQFDRPIHRRKINDTLELFSGGRSILQPNSLTGQQIKRLLAGQSWVTNGIGYL